MQKMNNKENLNNILFLLFISLKCLTEIIFNPAINSKLIKLLFLFSLENTNKSKLLFQKLIIFFLNKFICFLIK